MIALPVPYQDRFLLNTAVARARASFSLKFSFDFGTHFGLIFVSFRDPSGSHLRHLYCPQRPFGDPSDSHLHHFWCPKGHLVHQKSASIFVSHFWVLLGHFGATFWLSKGLPDVCLIWGPFWVSFASLSVPQRPLGSPKISFDFVYLICVSSLSHLGTLLGLIASFLVP